MWINEYEFGIKYCPERITPSGRSARHWQLAVTTPSDGFRKCRVFYSRRALLKGIFKLYPKRLLGALLNIH